MRIRSVDDFIKFIVDNNLCDLIFLNIYRQQSELIQQATVCKFVYNYSESTEEDKEWAKQWLEAHNMNVDIFKRVKV